MTDNELKSNKEPLEQLALQKLLLLKADGRLEGSPQEHLSYLLQLLAWGADNLEYDDPEHQCQDRAWLLLGKPKWQPKAVELLQSTDSVGDVQFTDRTFQRYTPEEAAKKLVDVFNGGA